MDHTLILLPVVGCLIGWLTNYVAIKLLFRPHKPIDLLGMRVQGLIPKRRKEIANGMARTIERELLSSKDISAVLENVDWKGEVEKAVEEVVEHRIPMGRFKDVPLVGLVSENLNYHIKYLITKEILKHVEKKKDNIAEKFKEGIDVKEMLATRIDGLDLVQFERLLTDFIGRELKHIEFLGGVMGFLIGLFQAVLFYYTR